LCYLPVSNDPHAWEGYSRQIERGRWRVDQELLIAVLVASVDLMLAVAGFAFLLADPSQIAVSPETSVLPRLLAGRSPVITTHLLLLYWNIKNSNFRKFLLVYRESQYLRIVCCK